ncbi:MAG: VCBS repeat-containing protein [Chloracidobacterium sp.]|nr:VCBS repeat-containing protein [Chloracidobacterium sp.]MCO5333275.1 FG-GAP-like repeat-containing protein [Pyrinomonadaceae bacterium]
MKHIALNLLILFVFAVFAFNVQAAVFNVNVTSDTDDGSCDANCSLREAVSAANAAAGDDSIEFDAAIFGSPQMITLTQGELFVANSGKLTVNGPGSGLLKISGNNVSRIIYVTSDADLTVSGITFTNGNGVGREPVGGGAIVAFGSSVRADNCSFGGNEGGQFGGAIRGFYNATVDIRNSTFYLNHSNSGGALLLTGSASTLNIDRSIFYLNTSGWGGAVTGEGGNVTIDNSSFFHNSAVNTGGGYLSGSARTTIANSTFLGNSAQSGGGIFSGGTLTITDTTVSGNTASYEGGGIAAQSGSTLTRARILSNQAGASGGGILSRGNLVITDSAVSHNTADSAGGIYAEGLTASGLTVSFNHASDIAGGIFISAGGLAPRTIENSTVSGNRSGSDGGGINSLVSLTLRNVTVAKNTGAAGGVISVATSITAKSSVFANNFDNNGKATDVFGNFVSNGFNLIQAPQNAVITGDVSTNIYGADPLLAPLKNYGGITQTHLLLPGSPAIDTGNAGSLTADQRGSVRPYDDPSAPNAAGGDGSDIGAFERQASETAGSAAFDLDGDGKSDVSVFRPSSSDWYVLNSTGGYSVQHWGKEGDTIVPADYDGDGKADIAVFRKNENSKWYILNSSNNTVRVQEWGASNILQAILFDRPSPADYDGDGKADLAVWRTTDNLGEAARFVILQSSSETPRSVTWGSWQDVPVPADYDGDQAADPAIVRSNGSGGKQWWIMKSTTNSHSVATFGLDGDAAVPADFTGDGKADVAVWRRSDGSWYVLRSEDGSYFALPFGTNGDIPVPADYDGDGKADPAVFRPTIGTWWINGTAGSLLIRNFGLGSDRPVPAAYLTLP